jgi:hypothetical protein
MEILSYTKIIHSKKLSVGLIKRQVKDPIVKGGIFGLINCRKRMFLIYTLKDLA